MGWVEGSGVGIQGVRTVFWPISSSGSLLLRRHQGISLSVIVQVLLAPPTSVRAAGGEGPTLGDGSRDTLPFSGLARGRSASSPASWRFDSSLSHHLFSHGVSFLPPPHLLCTHWKEGGRESPMPPVRSIGGGSSEGLSGQKEPGSGCEPSADTS